MNLAQQFLLDNKCDDLILNRADNPIYASDLMNKFLLHFISQITLNVTIKDNNVRWHRVWKETKLGVTGGLLYFTKEECEKDMPETQFSSQIAIIG